MRRYLVFAVVTLATLVLAVSATVVSVAFPQIVTDFQTSLIVAGWVLSISQLTLTIVMPLAGKASDIFGRKFIFVLCTGLFTIGSLLCAIAPNIWLLIFFRLIQAIGIGGFLPSTTAIVAEEFPEKRQQYVGFITTVFPIGQVFGPNLGGWLTEAYGWRSTFWICVPLGLIVIMASIMLLRKMPRNKVTKLDLVGAGLLSGIITGTMLGISLLDNRQGPIPWWEVSLTFGLAVIFLIYFVRRLNTVKNPIIDIQVLRERPFIAANIFNFLFGVGTLGVFSLIPLYAVSVFHMSTFNSGAIITPRSIAMIISSFILSMNMVRWGYRWPMIIGTLLGIVSLFGFALGNHAFNLFEWQIGGAMILIILLSIAGLSHGMVAPAANNACIELMPDKIGVISGVRGMFRQIGSAISLNLAALIVTDAGDMSRGFFLVFIGLAIISILTIPIILLMPRAPTPDRVAEKA